MRKLKRYVRSNTTLAEVIIFLIGAVLILIGKGFSSNIIIGIGTSIMASSIIVFMTDVMIGSDENETVKHWGLEEVHQTRGEMNRNCDLYLRNAKQISVIAFGLKSLRDTQQKQVERLLRNGGSIRIITMRPECANLKEREKDELLPEEGISLSIVQLIDWAKKLNSRKYKGKIEIRYHERQPLDFLFMMDNRLFTGPYEYGKDSQQSLSFEYNNTGKAYEYYRNYFNTLWSDNDFCVNALQENKE